MKRIAGYGATVLGWLVVLSVVIFAGGLVGDLFGVQPVVPGRAAVSFVIIIVLAVAAVLLIRSARSLLGRPGGSRRARFVLGLVLLAVGGIGIQATLAASSRRPNLEDIDLGIGVALALFGAALAFEGWWRRGRTAPLPG